MDTHRCIWDCLVLSQLFGIALGLSEYCLFEKFQAECTNNQVILMTEARYGRMRRGKCVTSESGELGCSVDALPYLDKACSGKIQCEFYVANQDLAKTRPCQSDSFPYLELDYICITVASASNSYFCQSDGGVKLPGPVGYVTSKLTRKNSAGSMNCPWRIEAFPGQSISIYLISLSINENQHKCNPIGYVTDAVFKNNITICQPDVREQHIFSSNGHIVDIQLAPSEDDTTFILRYQVTGCADVLAPEHAWHKREGNVATVGCEHQNKTWNLECYGSEWNGVIGTCDSKGVEVPEEISSKPVFPLSDMPAMVIILIIVAVIVIIGISLITIAITCVCNNTQHTQPAYIDGSTLPPNYGYTASQTSTFNDGQRLNPHIWETPLPEPQGKDYTLHGSMQKGMNESDTCSTIVN